MWDEITYQFPNHNDTAVEGLEQISNFTLHFHGTGTEIRYQDPSALPWSKMATATTGNDVYTAISTLSLYVSRVWRWV